MYPHAVAGPNRAAGLVGGSQPQPQQPQQLFSSSSSYLAPPQYYFQPYQQRYWGSSAYLPHLVYSPPALQSAPSPPHHAAAATIHHHQQQQQHYPYNTYVPAMTWHAAPPAAFYHPLPVQPQNSASPAASTPSFPPQPVLAAPSPPPPPQQHRDVKRARTASVAEHSRPRPRRAVDVEFKEEEEEEEEHSAGDNHDDADYDEAAMAGLFKKARRNRKPKQQQVASPRDTAAAVEPNGETRLDIAFASFGRLPANGGADMLQRWGKKGVIPDGLQGTFTFYSEQWTFLIEYHELCLCSDGVERYLLRFSILHKNEWRVHAVETEKQCRDRHQKGYTICNHVFALALDRRAQDYDDMIRKEQAKDKPNQQYIRQCQARVDKLVPKRVSEGPLLFGLRHKCMHDAVNEMLHQAA